MLTRSDFVSILSFTSFEADAIADTVSSEHGDLVTISMKVIF